MIIRSEPKGHPFVMACGCGAVLPLDATTQEEAEREAAARHICNYRKEARIEKAS